MLLRLLTVIGVLKRVWLIVCLHRDLTESLKD